MSVIRLRAPAKLNLSLHITGKRADGYHLLESLVVFTELSDVLEIEPAEELSLELRGPFADRLIAHDEKNLVLRAARALGDRRGARIVLHKHIPVGGGLGGGSADAAAALHGLTRLWHRNIDPRALALSLGSDVPVCLSPQPAWMEGVGEKVTPVALTGNLALLLVNPGIALATADVFRHYKGPFDDPCEKPKQWPDVNALIDFLNRQHNALEAPAIGLAPAIDDVLAALRAFAGCRLARMSGSGASCFGLYPNQAQAQAAANALRAAHPSWWCEATELYHG